MSLRDHLLTVRETFGAITPENVKEANRPKGAEYHAVIFNKPMREAAEDYYTDRAHRLIRVARLRYPTMDPSDKRTVRAFQAVRSEGGRAYVYEPTEEIAADPIRRALLMREAEREWRQLKARYEGLSEFFDLVLGDLEHVA